MQRDPIEASSGDPNFWRYCGNDPVNAVDPSGEDWLDFVPFVGSIRDIYEGVRDGDWAQAGVGALGLVADVATGGGGSLVKGVIKTGVKGIAKTTLKESAETGIETALKQEAKQTPKQQAKKHANAMSGNNDAAKKGKEVHKEFKEEAEKRGWKPEQTIKGKDGKNLRPDAIDDCERPVELKPDTPRGHQRAKSQGKKYKEATGQEPVIIFYDPLTGKINWPF